MYEQHVLQIPLNILIHKLSTAYEQTIIPLGGRYVFTFCRDTELAPLMYILCAKCPHDARG